MVFNENKHSGGEITIELGHLSPINLKGKEQNEKITDSSPDVIKETLEIVLNKVAQPNINKLSSDKRVIQNEILGCARKNEEEEDAFKKTLIMLLKENNLKLLVASVMGVSEHTRGKNVYHNRMVLGATEARNNRVLSIINKSSYMKCKGFRLTLQKSEYK